CNNQTIDELPQALPIFHPTFHSEAKRPFTLDSTPTYVDESPNVFNPPPQSPVVTVKTLTFRKIFTIFNNSIFVVISVGARTKPFNCQPPQYTVDHPIFNAHNDFLKSQNELFTSQNTIIEQMTQLTSMCEMLCQIIQEKKKEKRIEEEQAAKAQYWKIPACCDDDDDYDSAITPILSTEEPVNSLSMRDEHLDTILTTKSDEVIKSCVENLVPNPSESEGENGCDVPSCFTTFSNILFDDEYEFDSVDDQSLHNEDFLEKIFSNPLFEEEISSIKKNLHHFNVESDLVESMLNHDSSIISSSSKIDSLLDEFAGELTLLKSIPPGIDKTDCHPENEIRFAERLFKCDVPDCDDSQTTHFSTFSNPLFDDSTSSDDESSHEEVIHEISFKTYSSLIFDLDEEIISSEFNPIHNEDLDSIPKNDRFDSKSYLLESLLNRDESIPPCIDCDNSDSVGDTLFLERLFHDDPIPLSNTLDFDFSNVVRVFLPFFTYPVTSSILLSSGSEDTIFDPGITINRFYSF
nr:hypothetical protein [Tanacetum cinerariifolium]